jgi:hypothetical protein
MYTDILRRVRDAVRKKSPEKWRTSSWFLLHDNAPTHRSVLHKGFVAQNTVTTLEHPPCYVDLAAADFYLFSLQNSTLKGRRFRDATDIQNAMEELKSLSQNDFQECFQQIYSRWQKCVVA